MIHKISKFIDRISRSETNPIIAKSRKLFSATLCHPIVGQVIALRYQNRIPHGHFVFNTNCEIVNAATKARIFWGVYETPEIAFIKKYLHPELDVIELGSSLGVVASYVAELLHPSSQLVCVEANPLLLERLQENLHQNIKTQTPHLIHAAIDYSGDRESIEFSVSSDSLVSQIGQLDNAVQVFQVPVITLSEIIAKYGINQYTLICDIEGAEKGLIDHDDRALAQCQQLHIEMQDTIIQGEPVRVSEMVDTLSQKYGFQVVDRYLGAYVFERVDRHP